MSGEAYSHIGQLSSDGNWRWDGGSRRPVVPRPLPHWLNLKLKSESTWLTLVAAVATGLVADQAVRSGTFGLAASLTLALIAFALVFAGQVWSLESRSLAGASVLFAAWMTVRASPWLLWPDLATSFALIGAPIAIRVAVLLAAADPVFASFFNISFDFGRLAVDLTFVAGGALVAAGLLRLAAAEPLSRVDGPAWRLGSIEGLVVLAVLDAIFATLQWLKPSRRRGPRATRCEPRASRTRITHGPGSSSCCGSPGSPPSPSSLSLI